MADKPIPIARRRRKQPKPQPSDNERALEAVAYLLLYASDAGNEPVDGFIAVGLGRLLESIVERMR